MNRLEGIQPYAKSIVFELFDFVIIESEFNGFFGRVYKYIKKSAFSVFGVILREFYRFWRFS